MCDFGANWIVVGRAVVPPPSGQYLSFNRPTQVYAIHNLQNIYGTCIHMYAENIVVVYIHVHVCTLIVGLYEMSV